MKKTVLAITLVLIAALALTAAQQTETAADAPSLTIYNQNFAVVRERVPLDLIGMGAEELGGIGEVAPPDVAAVAAR